ncbi:MAG: hypothetical protein JWL87_345 [Candidatus Adlerbacteria bacterium]|nr:hypothetical protein [Candidatus Adlerbacteria bacterium]
MVQLSPKIMALIRELSVKGIVGEGRLLALSEEKTEMLVKCSLLGILDGWVDENKITREQADLYIERLDLTAEEVDSMRTLLRESQERKRHLN